MPTFSPLDTVPGLEPWQFAFQIDEGHSAGTIVRASVTQKVEKPNGADGLGTVALKCVLAVIDDQNAVQTDAAGDPLDAVVTHIKTLQTDAGAEVQVVNEVSTLVSECIGEFCNRMAVHKRVAALLLPEG